MKFFFLFALVVLLFACGEDSAEIPTPTDSLPVVSDFIINDIGNENSSRDIQMTFKLDDNLTSVTANKIVFAKAEKTLSAEEAKALAENQAIAFDLTNEVNLQAAEDIADSDGDLLTEGVEYKAYILFENASNNEVVASSTFSLVNQTLVSTLANARADEDITLDAAGNLYANGGSVTTNAIFKITTEGDLSTFTNTAKYPVGGAFDQTGNFYYSNFQSTDINKVDPNGQLSTFVSDGRFTGGGGLLITNDGTIYNTFFSQNRIFKITTDGIISELLTSSLLSGPIGMTYDREREIAYVANWNDGKIFRIESDNTLALVADTPANIGHISYANDHFYITGGRQNKVYQVNQAGEIVEEIGTGIEISEDGTAATASFAGTNGIEATPDGKIVYATDGGTKIRKIVMKRL
ncbi:MAG: hypothetical protein AB8G22_14410 [Saprospiraceae bacterium]